MKSPNIIYLQIHEFPDTTWCMDRINDDDVVYVRADELEKLKKALHIYADKENWTDYVTEEYEPEDWPAWTAKVHLPDKSAFYLECNGWEIAEKALADHETN